MRAQPRMAVLPVAVAVQVDEAHQGRFVERNSLSRGDFVQRVIDVRQMICGDVADEGSHDFVVAHAAVQPTQKKDELHADGKDRGEDAVPVCGHGKSL
jgi:hypothetical protein